MERRFVAIVLPLLTCAFFVVLAGPYVSYRLDPAFLGQTPIRLQDDGAYFSRIQAALLGRTGPYENGITAPELRIRAAGPGLLERTEGALLRWTGWTGVDVGVAFMAVIGSLMLPLLYAFLRGMHVRPWVALLAAMLFCISTTGILTRPHLSVLMPFGMLTLLVVHRIAQRPSWLLVLPAAVLLAVQPSLYFWMWMWTWASCATFFLLRWWSPAGVDRDRALRMLAVTAGLALLFALPSLLSTWVLQTADPAFPEMSLYRSGLYPSHAIASPIRSLLHLVLVIGGIILFVRFIQWRAALAMPLSLVIGVFLVMHQHVFHGKDFLSSSHYVPMATLSAVVLGAWTWDQVFSNARNRQCILPALLILSSSAILLAAAAWDYRLGWTFLWRDDIALTTRHLAPVMELLRDGERRTILTDAVTAVEVTSRTDDDVVFTPYVQHLLVSNAEFARRGCMADLFQPGGPDIEALAWHTLQFRGQHLLPQRTEEFRTICDPLLRDPQSMLGLYGVDFLLWNEIERSDWAIPSYLTKVEEGEGWSLWRVD